MVPTWNFQGVSAFASKGDRAMPHPERFGRMKTRRLFPFNRKIAGPFVIVAIVLCLVMLITLLLGRNTLAPLVTFKQPVRSSRPTRAGLKLSFRVYLVVKRWMDILLSGSLLLLFSPLMLLIAVLVKLDTPGPAIFAQERVGSLVRGKGGKRSWEMRAFTV